ncbi:MAG: hypothetical protein M3Y58_22380 [Chloroflexota bacterium]|nr:hypothetical protein [Chloroflexota bacterium]
MDMDDEMTIPVTIQPEDLFDDLRDQIAMSRLAEGLLCYSDPSFGFAVATDDLAANDATAAAN